MYRKILVGLDGSEHALRAARAAIEMALKFDAELHFLTVTRPYKVSPELLRYLQAENLVGEPKYVLDKMTGEIIDAARKLAADAGVRTVKAVVREGRPARTIVAYAKANHIDMIVVGSRGIGELEAALLGSVSEKVGLLAGCTVMLAR